MAMDEAKIVEKHQEENPPIKVTERDPNTPDMGHINARPYLPLYEHFQCDDDGKQDKAFETMWNWAKEKVGSDSKPLIILEMIKLSNRLGTPNLGEKSYTKLLNYITVSNQLNDTARTLKEMEHSY